MDEDGTHENGRHRMDYSNRMHNPWNMMHQHQMKEQNSHPMNKKILAIIVERDAAIHERNMALAEKKQALLERDAALEQRDKAIAERNNALMERDNAIAALQFSSQFNNGAQRGAKRINHFEDQDDDLDYNDSFPISMLTSEPGRSSSPQQTKMKSTGKPPKKKGKLMNDDLNMDSPSHVIKVKPDWDNQELGLNLISFDETIMPAPVCSCTGVHRQCYKGGNGGWQSSCCTTTLSSYPLPQMPNKRHSRMGGRKMGGNVFSRLITRLAAEGHDLSVPVDLKDYWARHGTNRYILIK